VKRPLNLTAWGVYSVWHRHAQVYRSTWLVNCLPPLSEPLIYLLGFGYGLSPLVGEVTYQGQVIPYLKFIAPGMMAIGTLFQSFFEGAYSSYIRLSYQNTWRAILTAPISFVEAFLGEWLWTATKGTIAGTLTGIVAVLIGFYGLGQLLISLPLIILGSLLFGAFGLLVAGTIRKIDQINVPIFLLILPMSVMSGTYFPRDTLPAGLARVIQFLPLAALADLLRWPLGLPAIWPIALLGLVAWTGLFATLAARQIFPHLFR